jgi:hypothetical protein
MPTGMPFTSLEGDIAETKWVIEMRNTDDPSYGRRQVRVFHYGQLIENRWTYDWVYPENTQQYDEEFYISITPDQLYEMEDADIPREDRGGNVGLWIRVTESMENGMSPFVDVYYITNGNDDEDWVYVQRFEYDVLFAYEEELVG